MTLAACGGGSDSGGTAPLPGQLNEPSCELQYSLPTYTVSTGADPLFPKQWHLLNTGQSGGTPGADLNVGDVWPTDRGEGVRVAVIDDAIEVIHEDLMPNVVAGGSYNFRPASLGNDYPLPCSSIQTHGTPVAGIIAARDGNALGVSGVAPRTGLVGLNALATNLDADIAMALGYDRSVNAIFHNSWGSPDNSSLNPSDASFNAAIDGGLASGRDGKGSIFVFPAGNGGALGDNSNFDGYVNRRGIITVCAVDHTGVQPWYGESGANVLLCGYSSNTSVASEITTTAIGNGYRQDFTGTSASTPMVSGVVALMLSANPALTWRDVELILASTAHKTDATEAGWTTNFGLNHNPKYGFGSVDAKAAVDAAKTWVSVGGSTDQVQCDSETRTPSLAIGDASAVADGAPAEDSLTIAGCGIGRIEFIEIQFTATHTYSGDLRVELISPNGLVSVLANSRVCSSDCGDYVAWPFGSVRHMNEPANGQWRLRVTDQQRLDTGTFDRWKLRIWGRG
ncbi:MAG: S8 family serine peptidase [Burkholderiaceae bacterium]|nr:S8 family serine peptidase [Burkholderiaceae bacterium]